MKEVLLIFGFAIDVDRLSDLNSTISAATWLLMELSYQRAASNTGIGARQNMQHVATVDGIRRHRWSVNVATG
jgi:hypothetical protein